MKSPILLLLLAAGCSQGQSPTAGLLADEVHYIGLSPSGQPVLDGRLRLDFPDDSTVSGSWAIHWITGADTTLEAGPQVGSGLLTGHRRGTTLVLDLNPGYQDNNVILVAEPLSEGYSGYWYWSSVSGPQTRGNFTATAP